MHKKQLPAEIKNLLNSVSTTRFLFNVWRYKSRHCSAL